MSVIECRALTKVYGGKKALNQLSCVIEENQITGLIGRNGAGKTTLLKIIAGQLSESTGDIRVFGEHPFNNLKVSANSIFIDDNMIYPHALNVIEILRVCERFYPNWDMELAKGLIDYFYFPEYARYANLSKGMKSTLNMIVGLAARCPLTIFDEPTTGMDQSKRHDFYRAVLKDYMNHPRTIILSSHLLNEMENILENILLIKNGESLLHMSVPELKEYAIAVQGHEDTVRDWSQGKEVIFRRSHGVRDSYVVTVNKFSEVEKDRANRMGLQVSPVSLADLCVYLTGESKGGIDDVFNRG